MILRMAKDLYRPRVINGRYENPKEWSSDENVTNGYSRWKIPDKMEFVRMKLGKDVDKSNIPCKRDLDRTLPINREDVKKLQCLPKHGIQVMWIGHASMVVQFDGLTILTDPIFSHRCSPLQMKGVGCPRYREASCAVTDLPKIDAVLISHDHYDHLDFNSVKELDKRFGDALHWFVPMGLKSWFQSKWPLGLGGIHCKNVTELTWWEHVNLPLRTGDGTEIFTFICTPAQHWCQRGLNDMNKNLWCSWVVKSSKHKFYFAGDTGYCPAFKQIGEQYGPFHLAAIPIGAYEPRWYMSPQHVSPEQAVDIFVDINKLNRCPQQQKTKQSTSPIVHTDLEKTEVTGSIENTPTERQKAMTESIQKMSFEPKFVGIHWGTFKQLGCYEPYLEPPMLVQKKMEELGIPLTCFLECRHGNVKLLNFSPG